MSELREILFRGKRIDNGEWVYGGIVHQIDYYGDKVDEWIIIDGETTQDYDIGYGYKVNPSTIGQFTGLIDRNRTKIFEGDIVRFVYYSIEHIGVVVWDTNELNFKITKDLENYNKAFAYIPHCEEIEIIGNIYDSSDLLKQ